MWIYFTPLPRAGFSFRGFCLSHDCRQLVAANHSLSSFHQRCLKAVAHFCQHHRLRPQGFVPCENPFRHTLVIHQYAGPIPSWFFLLQVFTRNSVPVPSHVLPPCTLSPASHSDANNWSLVTAASIGLSLPKLPTCSRFLAYARLKSCDFNFHMRPSQIGRAHV